MVGDVGADLRPAPDRWLSPPNNGWFLPIKTVDDETLAMAVPRPRRRRAAGGPDLLAGDMVVSKMLLQTVRRSMKRSPANETSKWRCKGPGARAGALSCTRAISVGELIHLIAVIAGAAAGLVGLAPVNWSWVRHRRSIPVRKHRDPDRTRRILTHRLIAQGMPPISYGKVGFLSARQQAKRRERSSSDEFSDLLRSASAETSRAGNAVVPTVTAEIEMEPDKDRCGMHSDTSIVLATALSTELVSFGSDVRAIEPTPQRTRCLGHLFGQRMGPTRSCPTAWRSLHRIGAVSRWPVGPCPA